MGLYDYRHIIANERTCSWFLHRLRWAAGVSCPACQGRQIWLMRKQGIVRCRCKGYRCHFSLRTDTLFEDSRLPLTRWLLAIRLFRIGISAKSLANVAARVAWALPHRLRDGVHHDVLMRKLRGRIEVDETYIGADRKVNEAGAQRTRRSSSVLKCVAAGCARWWCPRRPPASCTP